MDLATPAHSFVTPLAWAESQRAHVDELLVEQAHLERKAAAAAISFSFRIAANGDDQRALSALAREELLHFERTLRLLAQRGTAFGPLPPSPYAERLKAKIAPTMPERLVDELLAAALIEARSHERMSLLARALAASDPEVARFYADLCEAEERHERLYVDLARTVLPLQVDGALAALRAHEAAVLRALPWQARLHGGLPPAAAEAARG